mmetsp:Transcript_44083/g.104315  ORF Transcript_44083/g.104315 Transcript_44083/m.104315 type:complete len:293 (-) Transcript_44083:71-949(-)
MSPRRPETIPEAEPTAGAHIPAAVVAEEVVDLHEYGLSLSVDIDHEDEEDLMWVVQEAFHAPLPSSWTEYMDQSGRAYYVKEGSSSSTWEHPMDSVYRELLELIKKVRAGEIPNATEVQRENVIDEHLKDTVRRAKRELQGWSGPYPSDMGDYFHNEGTGFSTWVSPVADWEQELKIRHAVLFRCLLPERAVRVGIIPAGGATAGAPGSDIVAESCKGRELLQTLRLQLADLPRVRHDGDVPQTPSSARSFQTAKSVASSRSGRSAKWQDAEWSQRSHRKEKRGSTKERLQH